MTQPSRTDKVLKVGIFGVFLALVPSLIEALLLALGFDQPNELSLWELTKGGEACLVAAGFSGAALGELLSLRGDLGRVARPTRSVLAAFCIVVLSLSTAMFAGLKVTTETVCTSVTPSVCVTEPADIEQSSAVVTSLLLLAVAAVALIGAALLEAGKSGKAPPAEHGAGRTTAQVGK